MTTKVRLIRLLSDIREVERPPMRRTPLKPVMLYLMELRSHPREPVFLKKKLVIPIESKETATLAQPVKITHLTTSKRGDDDRILVAA
jgi:hypothetical protein